MADKIRFLTGGDTNKLFKSVPVTRGQVYFAINSDNNDRGTIVFDAPIDENTTKRIVMGESAEIAKKDSNGNWITKTYISELRTDASGLKLQYKYPDIMNWKELSFNYLPLTGGHVTGVLQVDSLTAGDLLVNGGARFVNKILGTIEKADQWTTEKKFKIADYNGGNPGDATLINGSKNEYTIKLPQKFAGALLGNADTSSRSKTLMNYYSSRQTSMNFNLKNIHDVFYTIASSTTTEGKPSKDSGILTLPWDYNGWGAQIAIHSNATPHIEIRGATDDNGNSKWDTEWLKVLDSSNYTNYTVKKDGTGATGKWNITAAKATLAYQDEYAKNIATTYLTDVSFNTSTNELWQTIGTSGKDEMKQKIAKLAPLNESTGLIDLKYIPQAALERVVVVNDKTARFKLTNDKVQLGDVVRQNDTEQLYFVVDEANLGNEKGYMQFSAGRAATILWSGILSRPNLVGRAGDKNIITLDDSKTIFTYYRVNSDGTNDSVKLAPAFLPLAGGHVTGVLQADSTTIGDLLVNGGARFVNTILGTIEKANTWTNSRNFNIASSGGQNPGATISVNGSSNVTLKLPAQITASLIGNVTGASSLNVLKSGDTMTGALQFATNNWSGNMIGRNAAGNKRWETWINSTDGTAAPFYLRVYTDSSNVNYIFNTDGTLTATKFKGELDGNAKTAGTWKTERKFKISSGSGNNKTYGTEISVNGSGNVELPLPSTIIGSLTGHASEDLPLKGGTMTGQINFNMYNSTQTPLKVYGGDEWGQGISLGAGGMTIVGSGESAKALESVYGASNEQLVLSSDNDIYFFTKCQNINERVGMTFDTVRQLYPNTNNTGSLGTNSYKWSTAYITTIYANTQVRINGNVTSANSTDSKASFVTNGGVSVGKQLSAQSIRVDNNQTNKGCTMKFNETLNCVEFVFD